MQINVKGKHLEITQPIHDYVAKKCERLTRYFDQVQSIDCVIEKEHNGFHVEFIVDVAHHEDFIVNYRDADLYAAIDLAIDREARQISEHKARMRDHKHNNH
ncbi:MAG: ribosome hibernation-promoting factor, HPF/YfiA family [Planctomycetota bacterium]